MGLNLSECWKSREGVVGKDAADFYQAIVWGDINPSTDNADDPAVVTLFFLKHCATISELGNALNNVPREWIAPGFWRFTVNFKSATGDRATNDASFSFTTGGGTQHVTNSRQTIQGYGDPTNKDGNGNLIPPPNFHGGINVTDSGVEGIDIHVPSFDFKTCYYIAPANMTQQYMNSLKSLTGKVNSDTVTLNVDGIIYTFQPGELLFLGADGSKRKGFTDWELTLNWSESDNAQNLTVGPITGISKKGWEYLWVKYKPAIDSGSNSLIQQPEAVYVEQVYDYQALMPLVQATKSGAGNNQFWTNPTTFNGAGLIT
jgi:hypothetical protein